MRARSPQRAIALVVIAVVGAACGPAASSGPPSAPPGGAVIVAADIAFDRTTLEGPADRPFALLFENREAAAHNVRIYAADPADALFEGEVFGGPASRTYEVPAIPPGTYRFRCDVHPDMAGTITLS